MSKLPVSLNNKNSDFSTKVFVACALILLSLLVFRIVFGLTYFKIYVVGESMENTLCGAPDEESAGGDYLYAFRCAKPDRGDIVAIQTNEKVNGKNKVIIKRVIAIGGDSIELKDGVLYLNGEVKEEPYVSPENNTSSRNNFAKITVEDGHYFCMGDNRNDSADSRVYGCIPSSNILGVVAEWSLSFKNVITAYNTFFEFGVAR